MPAFKALPEVINGFKVIEDLGTKLHSGKKRRFATFLCKNCQRKFTCQVELIRRKNRLACTSDCANNWKINNLKTSSGFEITSVGNIVKGKREVIAKCHFCKKDFKSTLQSLIRTKSCGCLNYGIGYPKRLMRIKKNMIERCYNPNNINYCRYGARGIKICPAWIAKTSEFFVWALANGYKDDLSIDRINNDGDYHPDNCRWATRVQQAQNTRSNKNLYKNT